MQCTVHTGDSLGMGIIEKYVGRYWMFNTSLSYIYSTRTPGLYQVLLGYGFTCPCDAQVVTGFKLVTRT